MGGEHVSCIEISIEAFNLTNSTSPNHYPQSFTIQQTDHQNGSQHVKTRNPEQGVSPKGTMCRKVFSNLRFIGLQVQDGAAYAREIPQRHVNPPALVPISPSDSNGQASSDESQ
jgi:hypothetical protein